MKTKLAIRGSRADVVVFEDFVEWTEEELDRRLGPLAEKHARVMLTGEDALHMIEIEFLDEPDPAQRFFRFGTDPKRMVNPVGIDVARAKGWVS